MSENGSTYQWILYTDVNFLKIFICTCISKKWCYGYIIVVYVHNTHHIQFKKRKVVAKKKSQSFGNPNK